MSNNTESYYAELVRRAGVNITAPADLGWFPADAIQRVIAMPDESVTDRPWRDACVTTGLTVDDFKLRLCSSGDSEEVPPWPVWIMRATVNICRAYGIGQGVADPAYIANVIRREFNNQKG